MKEGQKNISSDRDLPKDRKLPISGDRRCRRSRRCWQKGMGAGEDLFGRSPKSLFLPSASSLF